jgi:hypothetical protein
LANPALQRLAADADRLRDLCGCQRGTH